MHHVVTWEVDVWADSHREAAQMARQMQDADTTALVFVVTNEDDETVEVEL